MPQGLDGQTSSPGNPTQQQAAAAMATPAMSATDYANTVYQQMTALQNELASLQQTVNDPKTSPGAKANAQDDLKNAQTQYRNLLLTYGSALGRIDTEQNNAATQADKATAQQSGLVVDPTTGDLVPAPGAMLTAKDAATLVAQKGKQLQQQYDSGQISADNATLQIRQYDAWLNDQYNSQKLAAQQALGQERLANGAAQQQITLVQDIADNTMRGPLLPAVLDHWAPPGAVQDLDQGLNAIAAGNTPTFHGITGPLPFDPKTFATNLVMNALQTISPTAQKLQQQSLATAQNATPATSASSPSQPPPSPPPFTAPGGKGTAAVTPATAVATGAAPGFTSPPGVAGRNALIQQGQ